MPDNEMLQDAEFEIRMEEMGEDPVALTKFGLRQQFATSKVLFDHGKRIKRLEKQNKKVFSAVGIISAAIVATLDYFLRRG